MDAHDRQSLLGPRACTRRPGQHDPAQPPLPVDVHDAPNVTQAPPHTVVPAGHAHAPEAHTSPGEHALPQPPQLAGSVAVVTHAAPHAVWPAGHEMVQARPMHARPLGHTVPQAPQLRRSVARSRQAPAQIERPAPQVTMQRPAAQAWHVVVPVEAWYWPAAQARQAVAPVPGWALPAGQMAQAEAPAAENLPTAQRVQVVSPDAAALARA